MLIIDNIDSFVYNLYQYIGELGAEVIVRRNHIALKEVEGVRPDKIVISPGPGRPENAGNSVEVIRKFGKDTPILGVCLGHQAIGMAYGGVIERAGNLMHGKVSEIEHDGKKIYKGIENPFKATRYHSLAIEKESLTEVLEITAISKEDGIIQGVRHKSHPVEGIQFHPESILTNVGKDILKNFLGL